METKEFKVQAPEGYEIDKENSTFDCIKFKPLLTYVTYNDICNTLFTRNQWGFYITTDGGIRTNVIDSSVSSEKNNALNKKQLERLLALNQLFNIAEYYNKIHLITDTYYVILYDKKKSDYLVGTPSPFYELGVRAVFNNEKDAQSVIDNPNFRELLDTIYKS